MSAYLAALPSDQRAALRALRATIRAVGPGMEERMSGGAPFVLHRGRRAVGFGATKRQLSFFIMHGSVLRRYRTELAEFDVSRTVIHFTPENPHPASAAGLLVRARLEEVERSSARTGAAADRPRPRQIARK